MNSGEYEEYNEFEDDDELSIYDAAEIWASNGKQGDTFGYTEDELNDALNE